MSLRINYNVEAQNTLNSLTNAQSMFSQSMARLSSGKRINSAADDPAGYAISQKLQAQSTGLNQAQSNAQDGISLVQTAEGGLSTTQTLLQQLRQLAVQSANDTNTSSDRTAMQNEANQISQEITQIGNTTQFNTKNLLDGSLGSTATLQGANGITGFNSAYVTSNPSSVNSGSLAAGVYNFHVTTTGIVGATTSVGTPQAATALTDYLGNAAVGYNTDSTANANALAAAAGNYTLNIAGSKGSASINIVVGASATTGDTFQNVLDKINAVTAQTGVTGTFTAGTGFSFTNSSAGSTQGVTVSGSDLLMKGLGVVAETATAASSLTNDTVTQNGTDGVATLQLQSGTGVAAPIQTLTANGNTFTDAASGFKVDLSGLTTSSTIATSLNGAQLFGVTSNAANLQVGANAGQSIAVSISDMRASALGIQGTTANTALDISSSSTVASSAITTIDSAIATVSTQAASLGSTQNRLTAAINNLSVGAENMTAAYSTITDVNMAQESTNLATAQILQQSATAMLAQANQAPQGVLKLIGG